MRFVVLVKANEQSEAGVMPTEQELADMGELHQELVKAGVMVAGEGLHPSSKGVLSTTRARPSGSSMARSPRPRSWSPASGFCKRGTRTK